MITATDDGRELEQALKAVLLHGWINGPYLISAGDLITWLRTR